jgi:glycosyltransferase involved in cell wall biosynthesis
LKKICFVTAIPGTIRVFLVGHLKAMKDCYNISVVTNTYDSDFLEEFGLNINVFPVAIERKITLWKDLLAFIELYRLFRKNKFDAVHSLTPKAGLLSMVAACMAGVPVRIHTFTGQVWSTREGLSRYFLKYFDRVLAACATHVLVDSCTQRTFIINEGIVALEKSDVIANGSICGVDVERFSPNESARKTIRERLSIGITGTLFLFLARLTEDKGVIDLARAFSQVCETKKNVHLLVVGPDEEGMKAKMIEVCKGCLDRIYFEGFTNVPEQYMAAADVFCSPSYREGFPMAVVDAAATGIPAIGTRIYGVTDAIEESVTGCLYPPGDVHVLALQMLKMIENPTERKAMGEKARERVIRLFSQEKVTSSFVGFYESLLPTK